jgi:hypothetical protein
MGAQGMGDQYRVNRCSRCSKYSLWVGARMVDPEPSVLPANPDLPEDVRADYEEARSILRLSPRGAAALLRLAIQKLCVHLGESGDNLNADIGSLARNGLPVQVQQALDVVRVIGNESVHPGELNIKDDSDTAEVLFRLVNIIAQQMITQRREIADLFGQLPESKREQIKRRDTPRSFLEPNG